MSELKYLQRLLFLLAMAFSLSFACVACGGGSQDRGTAPTDSIAGGEDETMIPSDSILVSDSHEAVDLGLSVKWAACNVGASSPEDFGDYYAWGETTTKNDYSFDTYIWGIGTDVTLITKYCTDSDDGLVDNLTILSSSDDVATVKWGNKWRIPTRKEMKELSNDCTWTWTIQNKVNGWKVTGPNGNSIFLPAAGYRGGKDLGRPGSGGGYWSATLSEISNYYACGLYFDDNGRYWDNWSRRLYGFTIRPVSD